MPAKCNPKISIITVCLNSARFLEETIRSVRSQTYPNIEYVVIDGGSIDKYRNKTGNKTGGIKQGE